MSRDLENSKCQDILTTAKSLFWKYGIKRVSIKEICEEAGASKMTFYRFFDNKTDLVKTLWDTLYNQAVEDYNTTMSKKIPFPEKVKEMLMTKFKNSQDISKEFIMDIYNGDDMDLLQYITQKGQAMENQILDDFEQAQREGAIRPNIKRAFIIYQLHKIREMTFDENLLAMYDNPQELIMELTDFFFYGLLER